ncbi:MAG TPA: LLM class flavin-dependent oxidoreductase [Ilumatobacteraceae bacterium]|jgi:alkanesulfonate monooxygenase SsuD/methylene tetrahydromethanopterin reductase-like flavin-dependent oxidoreductase (luciferase family)
MIKSWLFEFFHQPVDASARHDPSAVHDHFRWYIDLWTRADDRNFHGIFFSEHHFGAAYSPSPNLLISHVAARTSRLRLGALGSVTPYATPWRIVEEMAMLDNLTGGRLEIGIVSGIPPELAVVGITPQIAAARHAEIADVLDRAIAASPISHHGAQWEFDDLEILPRFLQQPAPPVWTAVRSPESAERAGRRGWKACGGFLSAKDVGQVFDSYRAGATATGHPCGPEQIAVRRMVTFVDTPSQQRDGVHRAKRALLDVLNASAGSLPPWAALLDRPDESIDALSDDEFVSGTPAQVAEQLIAQCQEIGAGHLLVAFSERDYERLEHSHHLFSSEVAPALSAASVA